MKPRYKTWEDVERGFQYERHFRFGSQAGKMTLERKEGWLPKIGLIAGWQASIFYCTFCSTSWIAGAQVLLAKKWATRRANETLANLAEALTEKGE